MTLKSTENENVPDAVVTEVKKVHPDLDSSAPTRYVTSQSIHKCTLDQWLGVLLNEIYYFILLLSTEAAKRY